MKKNTNMYLNLFLKKITAGKKKIVIKIKLKEKIPIKERICKLSIDQEKLYDHKFHGNPVKIKLLRKSEIANKKLIKITEDISKLIK